MDWTASSCRIVFTMGLDFAYRLAGPEGIQYVSARVRVLRTRVSGHRQHAYPAPTVHAVSRI